MTVLILLTEIRGKDAEVVEFSSRHLKTLLTLKA